MTDDEAASHESPSDVSGQSRQRDDGLEAGPAVWDQDVNWQTSTPVTSDDQDRPPSAGSVIGEKATGLGAKGRSGLAIATGLVLIGAATFLLVLQGHSARSGSTTQLEHVAATGPESTVGAAGDSPAPGASGSSSPATTDASRRPGSPRATRASRPSSAATTASSPAGHAYVSSKPHSVASPSVRPTHATSPVGVTSLTIHGTSVLHLGDSVSNGDTTLQMRSDGNFVLVDVHGKVKWSAGTTGSGQNAVFQGDGNLAVYDSAGNPVWTSRTDGHDGAILVLQANGNLVISEGKDLLWQTGTRR